MALRSHLEQQAQLNSFGSRSRNTSSWGAGPPTRETSNWKGIGDSLVLVNDMDTRQTAFFEQLDKSHPTHLRRLERKAICCVEHLPLTPVLCSTVCSVVCRKKIKKGLLLHLTKSRKLLFLFCYQEHAHFSYQHVSLLWFYAWL